ncbi:MAG: NAD(P)-dependent glycerol-3-phosphate dehydrogenase [Oscillospiraceae bacterium]|jgi:glycerol-3-phosphate dehydrogenase (NAD(P)+)|nr:NAD(P)-dependent glycerol-3-phosphate dehydrogenase [Oscillospiraceae bacterium]
MKVLVVGSGAWGTALSLLLLENGNDVTLWSYTERENAAMRTAGENPCLKGVRIPSALRLTGALDCARDADVIVIATPSFAVRETAGKLAPLLSPEALVVSVAKGIENGSFFRMSEVICSELRENTVAALSGPSHAEEVGRGIPTAVVTACADITAAERIQDIFMNARFRVYTSDDIVGVELGAALKNVIALCAGFVDGMGFGDNTKAMLMTRGLTEIARVGVRMGGRKETFAGLAGMGDLIVTCTSNYSRNRRAGLLIGGGMAPQAAMERVGAVVEGYYAAAAGFAMAKQYGVELPITEATYHVLYDGAPLRETFDALMRREKRHESEESWF